jgi:hypothetical protein
MIEPYLEDLESRIDPHVEDELLRQWRVFAEGEHDGAVFSPRRPAPAPPARDWPHVLVNDALADPEAMVLQQLEGCSNALAEGNGALLAVRCNFGTAILPSLFGAELFLMEREIDTLPTCRPLAGGVEAVGRLLARGVPDLEAGQGGQVFEMGQRFLDVLRPYPKLARCVHLYHPDLQGPMNVCEMLWGGSLYVDFYDKPKQIHDFLALIAETYLRFMGRWDRLVGPDDGCAVHWSMLHRGRIMIRNDAATNFSPDMYDQFVRPYDQRLLEELGGGGIHFCGRGDHFIDRLASLSGVHAVNMTQPHLNDLDAIFAATVDRGINLIGFEREAKETLLASGRDARGRVHGW